MQLLTQLNVNVLRIYFFPNLHNLLFILLTAVKLFYKQP